jgi:hypothetical protein
MTINQLQIQEYMNLFTGSTHNYGEHIYETNSNSKEKEKGESFTITNKLITIEQYRSHLEGKKGLGIIPINERSKCKFAVIDIDIYKRDLSIYINAIEKFNFPLVPFKSKSGGLHLYLFLKDEDSPYNVKLFLKRMSFLLSIDFLVKRETNRIVEIFPKQNKLKPNDIGTWINLPYFNCKETRTHAIRGGKKLSLNDALLYIKEKQTTLEKVEEFLNELSFNDAPPCLQCINILNPLDENAGRNTYLFSFGVYLKKKDEEYFEHNIREVNQSLLEPLPEKELEGTIISSLKKKDYLYKCKESPLCDFCNKKKCREREFGIGKDGGYFSSVEKGRLYQYKLSRPYYEWEVKLQGQEEFIKLRFRSEEEIIKQDVFLKLCMRELHELPSKLKQSEWFYQVNQALKEIKIIEVSKEDDVSEYTILKNMVIDFLTTRAMALKKDGIFAKRVFFDQLSNDYFFRVKDLSEYLFLQKGFRYFSPRELHGILKEWGCQYKVLKTESGKTVRVAYFNKTVMEIPDEDPSVFIPDFSEYQEGDF